VQEVPGKDADGIHAASSLLHEQARRLRLLRWRLYQRQYTLEQLLAAVHELADLIETGEAAVERPTGDGPGSR
jgi:hypothetical protein